MAGRCRSGVAAALTVCRNREKIAGGKRDWRGVGAVLLRVLGTIEARSGPEDDWVGLSGQQRVVAALLASQLGWPCHTDRLVEAVWGEHAPPQASRLVQTVVSRLRRVLEPAEARGSRLRTVANGWVLDLDPNRVDRGRFEQLADQAGELADDGQPSAARDHLEEAVGLWRGRPFGDLADHALIGAAATRLEEKHVAAWQQLLRLRLAAGEADTVVADAHQLVATYPLRERLWAVLLHAQCQAGQPADALAAYQQLREHLADELGTEPSPDLQALHTAILRQEVPETIGPPTATASTPNSQTHRVGGQDPDPARGTTVTLPAAHTSGGVEDVPAAAGRLVGREDDVVTLRNRLADHRLMTVTGTGGVGKTRLVQHVVQGLPRGWFPDGIRWGELASVSDAEGVAHVVASAVGAPARPGMDALDAVIGQLAASHALLVLDNCEHVRQAVGRVVDAVLRGCPDVVVLTTSRDRLGVAGEALLSLAPLPLPASDVETRTLTASPAVELFVERARAVHPQFAGTDDELCRIVTLCHRLDGLPLAIELAAARLRSLSLDDLADRLDQRFRVMADPRSAGSPRHRTLGDVVDWSYNLLDDAERRLFDRLSVFAGAFTLIDVESVCALPPLDCDQLLELLDRLVDASMVTVERGDGPTRYRLLETLRAYGHQRLAERGEARRIQAAHAAHYRDLAEVQADRLLGPEEAAAVALLERTEPELRQAYRVAHATADTDVAARLVAALFRYALWRLRDEILHWAHDTIMLPDAAQHPRFPVLCAMAGARRGIGGDRDAAREVAYRGLETLTADDPRCIYPLELLMYLALWEGRIDDCVACCDRAAAANPDPREFVADTVRIMALAYGGRRNHAREQVEELTPTLDELGNPTAMAQARYSWGEALAEDEPQAAIPLLERAVTLADSVDNRLVAGTAGMTLTSLQARHGAPDVALQWFRQLIDELESVGDWTHLWTGLRSLADLLARVEAYQDAAVVLGAVRHAPEAAPAYGADASRLATLTITLEQAIGADELNRATRVAKTNSRDELVNRARQAIDAALT